MFPDQFMITLRFIIVPLSDLLFIPGDQSFKLNNLTERIHGLFHDRTLTLMLHLLGKVANRIAIGKDNIAFI